LKVGGTHSFQALLKRIARSEACLRELFSSDLGDGTELLDPDRADRKLSYCDKSGQVKEVPASKPGPIGNPKNPAVLVQLPAGNGNQLSCSEIRFISIVLNVRSRAHGEGMDQECGNIFHVTHGFPVGPLSHHGVF